MAIHIDLTRKSLDNLREEAKKQGLSARDHASRALEWLFSGDRSIFQFTPALPPELLPKCEFVFNTTLGDTQLLDEVHAFLTKRKEEKENERIQGLKKEDASIGETDESNDGSSVTIQ